MLRARSYLTWQLQADPPRRCGANFRTDCPTTSHLFLSQHLDMALGREVMVSWLSMSRRRSFMQSYALPFNPP